MLFLLVLFNNWFMFLLFSDYFSRSHILCSWRIFQNISGKSVLVIKFPSERAGVAFAVNFIIDNNHVHFW